MNSSASPPPPGLVRRPAPSGLSGASGADSDLLRAFAAGRDETAFRRLTERYARLVHGIALRRLGDAGAAQEVASEVFTLLARKASCLPEPGCLAAWLQRSAVLVTANAARRETRRRLAMKAYAASLEAHSSSPSMTHPPPDTADRGREEILSHLDESLARLPERDRRLLLARFFTGRNHGEIAAETGAGEEAVKKAAQRALRKLRTLLLRRGVTLSAAVLASMVQRQARAAVPEGLESQVSVSALRAAESLTFYQTARHSIFYMFHGKTLTAAAAALLLCAALGGGSFLAARELAMACAGPPPGMAADGPALFPRGAADSTGAKTANETPRGVAAVLGAVVDLLRGSPKEGSPPMDRAILLLAGLSPEEMREAAAAMEIYREDRPLAASLSTALGWAWSEQDPAAALAWLETFPGKPEWSVGEASWKIAETWLRRDGRSAWDWWKKRRLRPDSPYPSNWDSTIGEGMGHWARQDPAAAMDALGETDASPLLMHGFVSQFGQTRPEADSPGIEAAIRWKNTSMRVRLAVLLAGTLDPFGQDAQEPDRLFPVINRLCAGQPGALEAAASSLMPGWVAVAPEKAVEWILEETEPTPAGARQLMEPALRAWGERAPSEAWQWIQRKIAADPAQADRFYSALLDTMQVAYPRSGTLADRWLSEAWSKQIAGGDPASRDAFLRYWAGQWPEFAASENITVEVALGRFRQQIRQLENHETDKTSAPLAKQALLMAEAAEKAAAASRTSAATQTSGLPEDAGILRRNSLPSSSSPRSNSMADSFSNPGPRAVSQ